MRILIVGNFGTSWDGSVCDEEHIAKALEEMGHEVVRWQREETLESEYPKGEYDFILISQWSGYSEGLISKLRNQNYCPIVYWAFDYQFYTMEDWHKRLVRECDVFLTQEAEHIPYYKKLNKNTHWLPADFAPDFLTAKMEQWAPDNKVEKDIEVLFTGTYLPHCTERTEILKAVDKKFDLHVYSVTADAWREQGLKNVHEAVVDEGLKDLVPRAKINLSVDLYHSDGFWSDRNAQIMALGGLVLFRYVPLSEIVFRDAVQYFYNTEDCLQQIEWLLSQPSLAVAEMYGWNFAQQNLMVGDRVKDMLTIVGSYL